MFVIETPIPFSLYWVNESQTIDFRLLPMLLIGSDTEAWSPLILIPILPVMKLVQLRIYGDLHLPVGPSKAGPSAIYPVFALSESTVGGNATAPQPL